jgi:hypothetical protein
MKFPDQPSRKALFRIVVAGASLCAAATRAYGIITFGTGNNFDFSQSPENSLLTCEGNFGAYAGTTIGSQYLLTATHTNPGTTSTFTFNNGGLTPTTYNIQEVASIDDVSVWQIAPGTSATFSTYVPLYTGSSETGATVVDLGRGLTRGSAVTGGWEWGGYLNNTNPFSWGTNTISAIDTVTHAQELVPFGDSFLQYDFNNNSSNPNEAILAPGDSGGGLFIDDNGTYKLAGINSAVDQVQNSSGASLPYALYDAYGYYTTDSSNKLVQIATHSPLSSYASQISTKVNFINAATGVYSSSEAAASPVASNGTTSVFQNITTGAITGSASLQIGYASSYTTLQIAPGSGASAVSSLSLDVNSALDLTNNQIFINYGSGTDPRAAIVGYLARGYNGGLWNGIGIRSSTAAANPAYALGYADSADSLDPTLSSGQIEIAYTLAGDINLDGVVNGTDFSILAAHFGKSVTGGWADGDLNYDGVVNATDFARLAQNFGQTAKGQAAVLPASQWAALDAFAQANGLAADLPEPTTVIPIIIAGIGCLSRRRRPRRRC